MNNDVIQVLLVDDDEDYYFITGELLSDIKTQKYHLDWFSDPDEAYREILKGNHDVYLVDYHLGSITGLELIEKVFRNGCNAPMLMLTNQLDYDLDIKAMKEGVSDYLVKNLIDAVSLERSIRYAIERKKNEEKIKFLAYYDHLTHLPNRTLFINKLNSALAHAKRYNRILAVMFIDLDNFKLINDTLGHKVGDLLLTEIAKRMHSVIRNSDIKTQNDMESFIDFVARFGGDEFTIALTEIKQYDDASVVARRIVNALLPVYDIEGHELHITCSIGMSLYPLDGSDVDTLLKYADMAMYHAKKKGKNNFQYFKESMNDSVLKKFSLEKDMRKAVKNNEFSLYYQPIMDIQTGALIGLEALIRWIHPEKGVIPPDSFIEAAEENMLIIPIGEWVIKEVCRQYKHWHDAGLMPIPISVNLSLNQFYQQNLIKNISQYLGELNIEDDFLSTEITELIFMEDAEFSLNKINKLIKMGIGIAIDDFGTGFSSFKSLKQIPIKTLKIDRLFIHSITSSESDSSIVSAMILMGHSMKVKVVAEGVETVEQLKMLRQLKCDAVQGYLLSKPMPGPDVVEVLDKEKSGNGIGVALIKSLQDE